MERIIEIRAAEGGDDSKIFVQQLAEAYKRLAVNQQWSADFL